MATTKWNLDPSHSEIHFKVKHLMITNVTGQFDVISGEIETADDTFSNADIRFTAEISSINTGDVNRDNHLKSPDFFNAEEFPALSFSATGYNAADSKVTGELTIKGITKTVTLNAEFSGTNTDPWGNLKAGFSVEGKVNRTDFGLTWNATLETGGVLVSEEVRIFAEIQFVKQA